MTLDMLPVDYVSRAIATLGQQPSTIGQTFHLVHPQPVSSELIFGFLRSQGYAVDQVPYLAWRDRLLAIAQTDPTHILYPLITHMPTRDRPADAAEPAPRYATHYTQQFLHAAGLACPAIDHALLEVYLTHLIQTGILPPPDAAPSQFSAQFPSSVHVS
jgi:thioester reductase-like protein